MPKFTNPFTAHSRLNILVLGFYNRNNAGDEMYKHAFSSLLKGHNLMFVCTDDTLVVPCGTDVVVCGGGEIINDYFMTKITKLLKDFVGQVYAVSVGLSGESDARHLHIFDHVIMRNMRDYSIAKSVLGDRNCTYLPDITSALPRPRVGFLLTSPQKTNKNIGICLAQPVFYNKQQLLRVVVNALVRVTEENDAIIMNIFSFNTHLPNAQECDIFLGERIVSLLPPHVRGRFKVHYNCNPIELYNRLGKMDFNVCMRFHSVMFSLIHKVPFLAIYKSRKVDTLLEDLKLQQFNLKLKNDSDVDGLYHMLKIQLEARSCVIGEQRHYFEAISELISGRKQKVVPFKKSLSPFSCALESAATALASYVDNNIICGPLNIGHKKPIDVARILCHALTGNSEDPCVWGLSDNMCKDGFVFEDAMKFIYDEHRKKIVAQYCPPLKTPRKCIVSIDPFHNSSFEGLHRSGWSYVVGGLMNFDAERLGRTPSILVDTYVDRTFHWGQEVAIVSGRIPYKTHWVGFVHHTFDEVHSENNCANLFKNPLFQSSLKTCKAIIALSRYMATQLRLLLPNNVQVHALIHPTELVKTVFSFERFMKNPNKKLVQIGAWLRNPYAIYQLPLDASFMNPLGIRKAVLKGKDMDAYFRPESMILSGEEFINNKMPMSMCRPSTPFTNRYVTGMMEHLNQNDRSVEVISWLDNQAYDDFLSENIVFLNLVDCSAVNTVIECIVRNTPVIVNRHPALEEVLGKTYPGFYDSLLEAVHIIGSRKRLEKAYKHLEAIDKSKFLLETFLLNFMNILSSL